MVLGIDNSSFEGDSNPSSYGKDTPGSMVQVTMVEEVINTAFDLSDYEEVNINTDVDEACTTSRDDDHDKLANEKEDFESSCDIGKTEDDQPEDARCGYFQCKPSALQCCNNPKGILFWLCWFAFVQGFLVSGVHNVNTTTLEKRFGLSSSQVGFVSSSYDIIAGLAVLPMTYYGTFAHQPRMLSFAALCLSLGAFIMSLPHFITDEYEYDFAQSEGCLLNGNSTDVYPEVQTPASLSHFLFVLILGQFFNGLGGVCLHTIGIVYIDSNVKTKNMPLYQGIILGFVTLGPATGYVLGGFFLNKWIDLDQVNTDEIPLTPSDPRWLGAWWVGYVIAASLMIPVALGIFSFPRLTPAGKHNQLSRQSQAHQDGSEEICKNDSFLRSWKDAPVAMKILLKNPVFMFVTLGSVTESLMICSFATFLPKIIQNQFSQTVGRAALLAGFIAIPGTVIGNLISGGIMKVFNLKVRGMLRLCIGATILTGISSFAAFASCDHPHFAGVNLPYKDVGDSFRSRSLISTCNAACGCDETSYQPVCGEDGVQYFTPCHAGCTGVPQTIDDIKIYSNCSCVTSPTQDAVDAPCEAPSCNMLAVFLPLFGVHIMLTFIAKLPTTNVMLRCVPEKQRTFALGVNAVFFRFLGYFPGPLLFGRIFDSACQIWQGSSDGGETGSCWVYDNNSLAMNIVITSLVLRVMSVIFFSLAHYMYKPPLEKPDSLSPPLEKSLSSQEKSEPCSPEEQKDVLVVDLCPTALEETPDKII